MATSDLIASFIQSILDSADGTAELQRSNLAERFSCVPSQINYVISTRFSPEHGYIVESRRGGGGYIRITRVQQSTQRLIMHTVNSVGDSLDLRTAAAFLSNLISAGETDEATGGLIMTAISERSLQPIKPEYRDIVRASIFKQMLISLNRES